MHSAFALQFSFCRLRWSFLGGVLLGLVLLLVVPPTSAVSQERAGGAEEGTQVMLRDGTRLTVHDVEIGRTGIECRLGEDRLRLSWNVLAPRTVHEIRSEHLEESEASLRRWVELAEWCATYPELRRETIRMLERVLQQNPRHQRAEEVLGELGYVFRDGLARERAEWERRQREREREQEEEDPSREESPEEGETQEESEEERPEGPIREPGERLRVSVELVESIDWAGHARADVEPTRSAEEIFIEHLRDRDIEVTEDDPHFRIIGRVEVTCFKNVQFFETSLVAGFTGRANITATRVTDGYEIEIPEATSRLERTDAQAALDGALQQLARRLGANTAARLR